MKVAIVCQPFDLVLPPEQTSIGIWTHEVALRLAQDCDVTILARRGRGGPAELAGPWGRLVSVPTAPLRLWSGASRLWARLMPADRPLVAGRIHAPEYTAGLLRRLRALRPDVVHVQNMPQVVPASRRLLPDAAILLHMHCDWLAELAPGRVARSLAAVDTVIGCSRHVAQGAEARHPAPGRRFVTIPNGAPSPPSGGPGAKVPGRVIFVGRVSPEKGIHTLLQAWPRVVAAHPGARLEIVGPAAVTPRAFLVDLSADPAVRALDRFYPGGRARPGSYDDALRALVPQEIAETVRFAGAVPHAAVMTRLASASLLVNPSLSESFGMSLVEALSVDIPVVATRVGGMTDVVEATGGGLLVAKDDPGALAEAICGLLAAPETAAAIGRRGGAVSRDLHDWAKIAAATRAAYAEALSRRGAAISGASGPSEERVDVPVFRRGQDLLRS